ncbi:hypothetical protein DFH08DRAFT_812448 [Mycena albidolilacea]|uniref:Transposase n=1 Tax=Mycena albidolilacea TaxID=1033008 RepID=A0AAD7ENS0_9AGAR|nr:hypothetical protein DFH08DRAFT_812448 [Mycena albidolilacea]
MPVDAVHNSWLLFLNVLFIRYLHQGRRDGEELAYKLLETAQMANFHKYFRIYDEAESPPEFNWDHEIDQDAFWCRIEEDDNNSAWEDEEDEDKEDDEEEDEEDESRMDVDDAKEEDNDTSGTINETQSMLLRIIAMRCLKPKQYDSEDFRNALRTSELFQLMRYIAKPGNLLETSHPDVEESFRWHNWKLSYAELICDWVSATVKLEDYKASLLKPDPEFKFTLADAQAFLDFINRNPRMQPWGFNPMAIYLFVSDIALLQIVTYARVYQMLMQLPLFSKDSDTQYKFMYKSLDSRFNVVVSETAEHRTFLNEVNNELYRPLPLVVGPECTESMDDSDSDTNSHWDAASDSDESESDWDAAAASRSKLKPSPPPQSSSRTSGSSCPYCYNLSERKQCIRVLYKGSTDVPPPKIRYIHPFKQLNMRLVKFRKHVYKHCGKDTVGGVHFKPFSKKTLACLINNHQLVKIRAIRRRDMLHRWRYGTMTAAGSRQPAQGQKGDVYGPYTCHHGDIPDDIKKLFWEAIDADVLVEAANTIAPGLKKEINDLTRKSKLNYLGRTGLKNVARTNYISCIHPDTDHSYEDVVKNLGKKDVNMLDELGVVIIYVPLFNMYDKIFTVSYEQIP